MESDLIEEAADDLKPDESKASHHLEALMVEKKDFVHADKTLYRVYDSAETFQFLEADSAADAFEKSGLTSAHKIQREVFSGYVSLAQEVVSGSDEMVEMDHELPTEEEQMLFLDAALIDDAVEKSKIHFEEVGFGSLYPQEALEPQELTQEVESAPQSVEESPALSVDDDVSPAADVTQDIAAEEKVADAEEVEDEGPQEPLSAGQINALLAAQED